MLLQNGLLYLHQSSLRTIPYYKSLSSVHILLEGLRNCHLLWCSQTRTTLQDLNSCFSESSSPIHLSTEQKTAFVISYSNVWVVRSIIRFDGACLSYALVRSNCNKLVITWPLGRLTDLAPSGASHPRVINQPAPSWPCYNYYITHTGCKLSPCGVSYRPDGLVNECCFKMGS